MTARYVFWRTATGSPYRGTDGKWTPTEVLAEIGKLATVDKAGIRWSGLKCRTYLTALRAAVVVLCPDGQELNRHDAWSVVRSAMTTIIKRDGGGSPVDPSRLLREGDREAGKYFRKKPTGYVLVSSMSVREFPASRIAVGPCEISGVRSRARYPYPDVVQSLKRASGIREHLESTQYQIVRVKTSGRTIFEAAGAAFEALTFLRGLWNLFATRGSWRISLDTVHRKPLGQVHSGPIHTLHRPNGELVGNTYWYEADYVADQDLLAPRGGWQRIEKQRRWSMRRVKRLPYASDLRDVFARYVAALDSRDLNVSFLHLWGLLEKITDTVGGNYDETVRRTAWVFRDRRTAEEILKSVRCRRNRYVHAARSEEDREQMACMVKDFVDPHLVHLIRNDFKVDSLEEYGQFLALPTSIEALEKRRRRLSRAARTRKSWASHDD